MASLPSFRARFSSHGAEFVFRALRKRWKLSAALTLFVILGTVFYTVGQKKIYRATATLQIDPNPIQPLGTSVQSAVDMGPGSYWMSREYYATQYRILDGRAIAEAVVTELGLTRDVGFLRNLPEGAPLPPMRSYPDTATAAGAITSRLQVEPVRDSRLVTLSLEDASPRRAVRLLSAVVDVYLQRNVDLVVSSTAAAGEWLRGQVGTLKTELEESELRLHEYKKTKQILSLSLNDQSNMLREQMQQLNQALTAIRARREQLEARNAELDNVDPTDPTNLGAQELLSSTLLSTLRQEYLSARGRYASLLGEGKGDNHPDAIAIRAQVDTSREGLLAEVRNIQASVKSDLASVKQEIAGLSALFAQAEHRALDLNLLEIEYGRLERTKVNTEKLYGLVLERSKESDLSSLLRFNNIHVVESPMLLPAPVKPQSALNIAVGSIAGVLLGLGLMLGREYLDRRLRTPEEIETDLKLAPLGIVPTITQKQQKTYGYGYGRGYGRGPSREQKRSRRPKARLGNSVSPEVDAKAAAFADALKRPELSAHLLPDSLIAESARGLRTNILFASPDRPFRVLLVTSSSPGEGKTMVASTIAISMAQAGQKVLLVDCDLRRARLHRVFKKTMEVGVSSALLDLGLLDTADLSTEVPNLHLLPAGPRASTPAELLHSESFGRLLTSLKTRYDQVVIDSPPVSAVADAVIMSTRVDATVFVTRSGKTTRDVAQRAVRALRDVGSNVVGAVLNALEPSTLSYGKYSYYYYYGSDDSRDSK